VTTDTIKIPTIDQLRATALSLGFNMGDAELAAHLECLLPGFAAYNIVDRMPDEVPVVKYPRTP
jgi:amidase